MALKVKLTVKQNLIIADVAGEMDESTTQDLKLRLFDVIKQYNISNVLFDLSKLDFIDSTGIGLMLSLYNKVKYEGKVYLSNINRNVEKICLLTGLYKICEIVSSKDDVVNQLGVA